MIETTANVLNGAGWNLAGILPVAESGAATAFGVAAFLSLVICGVLLAHRLATSPHPPRLALVILLNSLLGRVWYRVRRVGPCTVPRTGPAILVANHTCTADPLILYTACPYRRISFLIAREYADLPFWGQFVRMAECIPVRRGTNDVAATRQALRHLRDGKTVGIFLEGRVPVPGETTELKHGAALIALRSGVPIIPAHISGTLYRDGILPGFLARHRARVRFGPPIDLSSLADHRSRAALEEATRMIHRAIGDLAPSTSAPQACRLGN